MAVINNMQTFASATSVSFLNGLTLNAKRVKNIAEPSSSTDAASRNYVDNATSGMMTTNTDQEVIALKVFDVLPQSSAVPSVNDDFTNKAYVDGVFTTGTTCGSATIGAGINQSVTVTTSAVLGSPLPSIILVTANQQLSAPSTDVVIPSVGNIVANTSFDIIAIGTLAGSTNFSWIIINGA